ncbi:PAS domain S-box protein [Aureibaculum sp. A20]|uniref:histidine kinase n=1 Tax=Aureibaculum flavum TaxID=2795986 RepID=A0ABS0WLR1_9FLAO|nr:PAS domain-containing sensor histidine kinase [Aureibaculum flavum]MBJ2172891.1 PAS domain S-box protein [Aureibaculum flavum]
MFQQNQDIFSILSEAISECIIIIDNDQKIVSTNSSTNKVFGYTSAELIGKSLEKLIPKKYHKIQKVLFKKFVKKGEKRQISDSIELYGLRKNGAIFPTEIGLNPFTVYGKTYNMVLLIDITERKENEKNLLIKSEALQSAANGIVITDALQFDNPIIYCNSAFIRLTGYSESEIINKNCRFLQTDDRDQESIEQIRLAIKEGKSCKTILRNYKKDGTLFWNDLSVTPIKNNEGVVTHFIGIQNDITKRMYAEQELKHWASIFDESLNEIFIFDKVSLKFLNANRGAQKNIGYTLEELKELTPFDIKPEIIESDFRALIAPLIHKDKEKIEFEAIHQRKDGTTYPVEVHLQLSSSEDHELLVAIILDITERKNYTEKLENTVEKRTQQLKIALTKEKELNELKTKFLSLVSHEFKTPLSGILTSTILLEKYKLTEQQEKRDKHLNIITSKVHYLNNILNDFLSIERLELGKVTYKFTDFNLSKVVNEVVYNANMLLKGGQKINISPNSDEFNLHQDERILELILSNLIYNSIKYSPENTDINLEVSECEKNLILRVIDYGIGIPINDQKHIFNRYFRAENVLNNHGTGIGLNIIKAHLENLGGTINFKSEENNGSTFTVELPKIIEK